MQPPHSLEYIRNNIHAISLPSRSLERNRAFGHIRLRFDPQRLRRDSLLFRRAQAEAGARGGARTRTPLRARDFKSPASANSATRAYVVSAMTNAEKTKPSTAWQVSISDSPEYWPSVCFWRILSFQNGTRQARNDTVA